VRTARRSYRPQLGGKKNNNGEDEPRDPGQGEKRVASHYCYFLKKKKISWKTDLGEEERTHKNANGAGGRKRITTDNSTLVKKRTIQQDTMPERSGREQKTQKLWHYLCKGGGSM